jgi:high-affinity iron transporter
MLPTLVIFFRESLEASLIVGIILAYLHKVGRGDGARAVWWGVGGALAIDLGVAVATFHLISQYDGSRVQTILEGGTYIVATGLLTAMSFWMKRQGGAIRGELEAQVRAALGRGSLAALVALSALTVGREGLETAFFTLAVAFTASAPELMVGALAGLLCGLAVSWWIYRLGRRAPLTLFFNVLGVLLLLFAAGLLADGIQDFQSLGWLPVAGQALWSTARVLSESSALGDILHAFFGYAQSPTLLQVGAYVAFLLASVASYTRLGSAQRRG